MTRVYRELRDDDARAIGTLHRNAGHRGSARNCAGCRAELKRNRELAVVIRTEEAADAGAG